MINTKILVQNKDVASVLGVIVAILMAPLIAMQFTNGVNWGTEDFTIIGILLSVAGSIYILITRKFRQHKIAIALMVLAVVAWLWAELAVGIFTNWGS